MKKAVRFGLLVGVLGLASWAGLGAPAHATHASCSSMDNTPCTSPGTGHTCTVDGGGSGFCRCATILRWICFY